MNVPFSVNLQKGFVADFFFLISDFYILESRLYYGDAIKFYLN